MQVGTVISEQRKKLDITQKQLASDLGVSHALVTLWESNKRLPNQQMLLSMLDYFDISADEFFKHDRKNKSYAREHDKEFERIINIYDSLNEDNKYIIIGEATKLLLSQKKKKQ